LLALSAAGEAAADLILLVYSPILVKLLFGAEIFRCRSCSGRENLLSIRKINPNNALP
jgi:hypothetical protein